MKTTEDQPNCSNCPIPVSQALVLTLDWCTVHITSMLQYRGTDTSTCTVHRSASSVRDGGLFFHVLVQIFSDRPSILGQNISINHG